MKEYVKIGVIGTGSRGLHLVHNLCEVGCVKVAAVCDLWENRVFAARNVVREKRPGETVHAYFDYKQMLAEAGLDGVVIATSWDSHITIAVDAMNAGAAVAVECGGASSIDECFRLVRTSEVTGMPCMFLENCCYARNELSLLKMVRNGVFGEIVHCEGAYQHDLRDYIANYEKRRQERWGTYLYKNAELYPSHELGPIMKWLNINRGNRIVSLTAMASKSRGLDEYSRKVNGVPMPAEQGDVVTTLMKCAHGETIRLTYDTTLPRPYSRGARLQGTKGLWMEDNASIYIEGISPEHQWEKFDTYLEKPEYEHELWTKYRTEGVKTGGHGGIDYLVVSAFAEALRRGIEMPLDVYDAALIMAITPLSAESIARGGMPVTVPDFTDGRWIKREKAETFEYSL